MLEQNRKIQGRLSEKGKALSLVKAIDITQTLKPILLQFEQLGRDQKKDIIESKRAPAMVRSLGSALIVAWNILQEPGKVALCINLSVLTARNETIWQEYVVQTTAVQGTDLKTEGIPDPANVEPEAAKEEEDLQMLDIERTAQLI